MKIYKVYVIDIETKLEKDISYYKSKKKAKIRMLELYNQYCGFGTQKMEKIKVIK